MEFANRICPNCKNPNYVVFLGDFSKAFKYKCMNCNQYFNDNNAEEPLKEQQKKEIKLHKKYTFSLRRTDEFSMRKLYEIICETLMDEGKLIISRTDDHEKVDFVWEIREDDTD